MGEGEYAFLSASSINSTLHISSFSYKLTYVDCPKGRIEDVFLHTEKFTTVDSVRSTMKMVFN